MSIDLKDGKIITRIYKQMGRAIADYNMLNDGDRVLVAISANPHSLAFLKLLELRKANIPIEFNILACLVYSDYIKFNKETLNNYLEKSGISLTIERVEGVPSESFWCTKNARQSLYRQAADNNCNKIALGHNLDDIIKTTLFNLCFQGQVKTWQPCVKMFDGAISVIRPLCFVMEKEIFECAKCFSFPDFDYSAMYAFSRKKQGVDIALQKIAESCPSIKKNIFSSFNNIKKEYLL
jgi:tRNA 2-thiocytidine biosynthesis protein TtcA